MVKEAFGTVIFIIHFYYVYLISPWPRIKLDDQKRGSLLLSLNKGTLSTCVKWTWDEDECCMLPTKGR